VNDLLAIREKLGITTGGIPPCCSQCATNLKDVGAGNAANAVSESDIEMIVRKVLENIAK
jgi:hypothetical protein